MTDPKYLPTFAGWLVAMGEDVLSLANLLESTEVAEPYRRVSAEALESLLRAAELIPEGLESLGYLEQAFVFRLLARRAAEGEQDGDAERESPADEGLAGGAPLGDEALGDEALGDEALGDVHPVDHVPSEEAPAGDAPSEEDPADEITRPGVGSPHVPAPVPGRVARLAADVALVEEFVGDDLPALLELAFTEARRGRSAVQLLEDEEQRSEVLREARAWVEGYRAPELAEGPEELVKIRSFFRTRLQRAS
jgi:hypothetical protein